MTTNELAIRKAELGDLAAVQEIARATFFETFAATNTEADMQHYLTAKFSDAAVSAELSHPDSSFFIAWTDETPVGYLKINIGQAQTEPQGDTALEIERIYVRNAYHGKKVGHSCMSRPWSVPASKIRRRSGLASGKKTPKRFDFT